MPRFDVELLSHDDMLASHVLDTTRIAVFAIVLRHAVVPVQLTSLLCYNRLSTSALINAVLRPSHR